MTLQISESTFLVKAVLSKREQACVRNLMQRPGAKDVILQELEKFRTAGNTYFKNKEYEMAVQQYTMCIRIGHSLAKAGTTKLLSKLPLETLKLVASNRAQACLELRFWELAWRSAEDALRLDLKHVKSLFRKGKAFEGLQDWKKAIATFESALELNPEVDVIKKALEVVKTAYHQSVTGEYDLTEFCLVGGVPPLCSDYVGPVEIGYNPTAGRALYLTQPVEAGHLIMATNALGVGGSEASHDAPGTYVVNLADEFYKQNASSARYAHQLYYLRSGLETSTGEDAVPPLELYIPGSDWAPDPENKIEPPTFEKCFGKAKINSFDASQLVNPELFCKSWGVPLLPIQWKFCAVWALPSFINHSCAPNCFTFCVGKTMFVRAAESMPAGTELTISYVVSELLDRKELTSTWNFVCKCERCELDELVRPHMQGLVDTYSRLLWEYADSLSNQELNNLTETQKVSKYEKTSSVIDCIEDTIKKLPMELDDRRENWIRFSFHRLYYLNMFLGLDICTHQEKTEMVKRLLGIYNAVNTGNSGFNLHLAASLLQGAEVEYGKDSMQYQKTKISVKLQFEKMLGKITDEFFLELLETKFLNSNQVYPMTKTDEMPQRELNSTGMGM